MQYENCTHRRRLQAFYWQEFWCIWDIKYRPLWLSPLRNKNVQCLNDNFQQSFQKTLHLHRRHILGWDVECESFQFKVTQVCCHCFWPRPNLGNYGWKNLNGLKELLISRALMVRECPLKMCIFLVFIPFQNFKNFSQILGLSK